MARLYQKTANDLPSLPTEWQTREELLRWCLDDLDTYRTWATLDSKLSQGLTVPDLLVLFFMKNSWLLTKLGAVAFSKSYRRWQCIHDENSLMTGKILMNAGKIFHGPWYNNARIVYIWNELHHFEMQMFDGSIKRFVEFYLPK